MAGVQNLFARFPVLPSHNGASLLQGSHNVKLPYFLLLTTTSLLLVGCASLRATDQSLPVACNTAKCQVQIEQTGQTFEAPGVYEFARQKELDLTFKNNSEKQTQKLRGEIRWKASVLPNTLLSFLGPTGWVWSLGAITIDWLSGNIWELPAPKVAEFKDPGQTPQIHKIILAPVQASTQLDSEEATAKVLNWLRTQYPGVEIEVPEQHHRAFAEADWDHDGPPEDYKKRYELYRKLQNPFLAVSKIKSRDTEAASRIEIHVFDILRQKKIHMDSVPFIASSEKAFVGTWFKSQLLTLTPNALSLKNSKNLTAGVAFANTESPGTDNSIVRYYSLSSNGQSYKPTTEWALTLTNVDPMLGREFTFVSKLTTEGSLRRSSLTLTENSFKFDATSPDSTWKQQGIGQVNRYYMGLGLGPEWGIAGPLGYLYVNFIYSVELAYFDFSTTSRGLLEVYSPLKLGLGYTIRINERFQLGTEMSYSLLPPWVSDKMLSTLSDRKVTGSSSAESRFALALSYYLPEMKNTGKNRLKTVLTAK